jgi:hypothetical protein
MQGHEGGTILTTKAADSSTLVAIFLALKTLKENLQLIPLQKDTKKKH